MASRILLTNVINVVAHILNIVRKGSDYHGNSKSRIISIITSRMVNDRARVSGYTKSQNSKDLTELEMNDGCRLGIDTHADTSCAGKHVRIMSYVDGVEFNVAPYHPDYAPMKRVGMINGIVAVDKSDGSGGYILQLNNFLNFTDSMDHSILCPMQARMNGVVIDDVPTVLDNKSSQSIIFPGVEDSVKIQYHGPIPYIPIRYPTDDDMNNYTWINLTSSGEWNPYNEGNDTKSVSNIFTNDYHDEYESIINVHDRLLDTIIISGIQQTRRLNQLSPERLSKLWKIPLSVAKRTLKITTHNSIRTKSGNLYSRYRTNTYQRRYRRLGGQFARFYTDTLFSKVISVMGHTCAQIFCNKAGFIKIYPMNAKSEAHNALSALIHEIGIPHEIHSDNAPELSKGEFKRKMNRYEIYSTFSEPYSYWQNEAERSIRIIKSRARYFMQETNTPLRLWDYAFKYVSELASLTSSDRISMLHRTPFEDIMGYSPNISEYASFEWFEWIWYWDPIDFQKQKLGRWCGVANTSGSGHTYYVLNSEGRILSRSTVAHLSEDESDSNAMKTQMDDFSHSIKETIGDYSNSVVRGTFINNEDPYSDFLHLLNRDKHDENELIEFYPDKENQTGEMPESDEDTHDTLSSEINDNYIGVKVLLPVGGEYQEGVIQSRKRNLEGTQLIGKKHNNPLLDTRVYKVKFHDGGVGEFSTNIIAENLYSNIDEEGHPYAILSGIINHRKTPEAITLNNAFVELNGRKHKKITTKGWEIQVQWEDGSTSWIPMKDLKASNPIELAEYAYAHNIHNEPAFAWWTKHVLKTRDKIISKIKTNKSVKRNIKFGVEIPNSYEEALALDRQNGNDLWERAINKELDKVRVAFKLLDDNDEIPTATKLINYHLVFDVKMTDLQRKARLVAGGHLNRYVPKHITYSSVVSRESVRICFLLAALNDLDILAGDVGNAYLNARPLEKCYVKVTDPHLFGPSAVGKFALIVRALYGMKSSGNSWRLHYASILENVLGFKSCYADNDVWLKPSQDRNGNKYYSYICIYVDDILILSKDPKSFMDKLKGEVLVKPESIEEPKLYLGTDIRKRKDQSGNLLYWILGSNSYLKEALRIVNEILNKEKVKIHGKGRHPFSTLSYRPELDTSHFCDENQIKLFQSLVGMLRWIIELGRVDILLETSLLSSYLACPRVGHLHQALHIFHYLKHHNNSWLPMDPQKLDIEWTGPAELSPENRRKAMKEIYREAKEEIPENMPEPRGESVQINLYVDADHAGNKITRRSHTGILIFLNMAPISFYSKKQNTVESSTFGSEFIAMKIAMEKLIALRYKLRMMGVPIDGPSNVFCDNDSVVKSSVRPEAVLKKKCVSIAYHKTRECFASAIANIYFEYSDMNLADLFTKVLPAMKRKHLFSCIFA